MASEGKHDEERIPGTEDYHEDVDNDEYYGDEDYVEGGANNDDPELEEMKKRVQEMEDEQEKLTKLQQQVEKQIHTAADSIDENSV
jgi:predicted transcriptional regulator